VTLIDWLGLRDNFNLKRVTELMVVNHGRLSIEGNIGSVLEDPKINRYGRLGLTLNEAFELQYYKGIIDGLTNAHPNPELTSKEAMARINREASGRVIDIPTPEQRKVLLGGK
jgi:hypothetical protein